MPSYSETVSVGTSATALRPTAPVTDGDRGNGDDAKATMFVPSGGNTIHVGDSGVANTDGIEVAAGESYEWNPGQVTLYGAAETGAQDVEILWTHASLGSLGGIINVEHTAPS